MPQVPLIPISILFQFVGVAIVGFGHPLPGVAIALANAALTAFYRFLEHKQAKAQATVQDEIKEVRTQVQNLQLTMSSVGLFR